MKIRLRIKKRFVHFLGENASNESLVAQCISRWSEDTIIFLWNSFVSYEYINHYQCEKQFVKYLLKQIWNISIFNELNVYVLCWIDAWLKWQTKGQVYNLFSYSLQLSYHHCIGEIRIHNTATEAIKIISAAKRLVLVEEFYNFEELVCIHAELKITWEDHAC